MEFNRRAVDIEVNNGIPNVKNIGIKINAAPTPAIVKTAVKIKVITPAMIYTNILTS